jgi:hypothetical protein
MQLNLLSTCPPSNITTGPSSGIDRLECFVTSADSDMVPVTVTSYVIAELDQNLQPVRVKNVHNVTLFTGDNVTFMSTTHSEPAFVSGGLQVSINGINAGSQIVTLQFLVEFTNLCNTPPFSDGDSVGWLTIVSNIIILIFLSYKRLCESINLIDYVASRNADSSEYVLFKSAYL